MPVASQRSFDIGRSLTRSSLAVISDTTRPAPSAAARRRNGTSVTPDIGARKTGFAIARLPIFRDLGRETSESVTDFSFEGGGGVGPLPRRILRTNVVQSSWLPTV